MDSRQAYLMLLRRHSDGDVDLFGDSFDQTVTVGQRCAPLEQQARTTWFEVVEKCVERSAGPIVFFDVLCICLKLGSGPDKQIKAVLIACGQHSLKTFGHPLP